MNITRYMLTLSFVGLFFTLQIGQVSAKKKQKPNVLFIAIDDINDWVGPLGGHPQAQTPNLDKFCEQGSVVFKNAVCAAPICGPSRSAVLSGYLPSTTGVYGNATNMIYTDIVKENATLPEYFAKNGYYTLSNGKIFHKHAAENGVDFGHWAFDEHERSRKGVKDPVIKEKYYSAKGVINGEKNSEFKGENGAKLSWGPTKSKFEETVDHRVVSWASERLQDDFDKPFFMAVGLIKPHLPWFVPQEFYDKFPLETIQTPKIKLDDLDDILKPNGEPLHTADADYNWVTKHGLEKEATQAYLANINYADACLGILFEALEKSKYADNTIVVIWGDHGWHLGEKLRYKKNTLWNEVAKTPLIVSTPNMTVCSYSEATVSLIDMYPTLIDYCDLPQKKLDGESFTKLINDPHAQWTHPGVTVSVSGTSVMGERWHYISNLSGTEEFYDLKNDPMEWDNLAQNPEYAAIINKMKSYLPKTRAVAPRVHYKKPPNYVDADADPTIRGTRDLNKLK